MKHLVYCVLREVRPLRCALPAGIEGAAVFLVVEGGLAAACSVVPASCAAPTVSCATAYARAVDALHRATAVLPLRYGQFLEGREQVRDLLRRRRAEFLQALEDVQGCEEMGLRIFLEEAPGPAGAPPVRAARGGAGRAYLEGRRACYVAREDDEVAAAARGALERLAVKCREERSTAVEGRLLSLFFLVRRENVGAFREAFRRLERETGAKALLTGPWPPYNFVGCQASAAPAQGGRPP